MTAVYLNFLTECSHIDHCPFLVGPYRFFQPYHLTCMAIILYGTLFHMAFKRNCTGDHTGHNYDNM